MILINNDYTFSSSSLRIAGTVAGVAVEVVMVGGSW